MFVQPCTSGLPRGRFAPSPSGDIHIGNALSALLSWLQIRRSGGSYILRMEDIDAARCRPEYARRIPGDLRWLGLDWDEGPDIGGPFGPYTQSERMELYEEALTRLSARERLYPCFCSRHDLLQAAAAPHGLSAEGPVYPGTCRRLSAQERSLRAAVKSPSLRFAVTQGELTFADGIAGKQTVQRADGGDFVVRRADGIPSYQLAVVVDDALMGITEVLRGFDLLDSTPRQLMLFEALGWSPPRYSHSPLLIGPDGRRLAKRHGGITLAELRESGVKAERVAGWLAWVSGLLEEPEERTPRELIAFYDQSRIARQSITVTPGMLAWLTN
ncbi:tRNA glutamyl-Q(34) synthetase GluQRS [Paenibacillus glufosinatiresistens]|uniref:tRNA glutamyl-Q(34) synthetase GluQRS n=1 Tax=Paenibacillus glufosinatiresistens TaxID=3070657 RepID=UPI00286E8D13|nr:tRNA glutamyl-Q(34) synthetase GluQRS [Paenibacillus sp. YX.27]